MKYEGKINIIIGDTMGLPEDMQEWVDEGGMERALSTLPGDDVLIEIGKIHTALSDPIRLKILHLLAHHPLCVCLIKQATGISDSKLSYHLSVLKNAGLIRGKRRRNWIIYEITEKGLRYVD